MATLSDVARKVGVSHVTVSAVLGGKSATVRVGAETRQRILAAAQELGYRPNSSARAIRLGRFGAIGLVRSVSRYAGAVPPDLLDGIHDALEPRNLHLTDARLTPGALADPQWAPKILREMMADGLLIHYTTDFPQAAADRLREHALPSVWINSDRDTDCVRPDDWSAAHEATHRLLQLGHRNIGYVAQATGHYSGDARYDGYADAMRNAGQAPRRHIGSLYSEQWFAEAIELLSQPHRPTALVLYTDWAQPVLCAALRLGLRVPGDVSLITFHAQVQTDTGLRPATYLLPHCELGQAAVEMLEQKIATPDLPLTTRVLSLSFEAGETLAPPRRFE